jgi:DNA modification methylase
MSEIKLINGDCLKEIKKLKDKSIDLVLIDPPYNINIKGEKWDNFKTIEKYVEFMGKVFKEIERVLKDNGSFYFFHNDFLQVVELQNWLNKNTNFIFKSFNIWDKGYWRALSWKNPSEKSNLRTWFNNTEYCLFYTFQDETGRKKVDYDVKNYKSLRDYSRKTQKYIGTNKKNIINEIGQKIDHFFRYNSSQFSLPTKETYQELIKIYNIDKMKDFKTYDGLRAEYDGLRAEYDGLRAGYESQRYVHNLDNDHCVMWKSKERNGGKKHACEKPIDLLTRIIKTSSNENHTVLDCFMGSGSTGVACKKINRNFIGIELDEKYFNIAKERIKAVEYYKKEVEEERNNTDKKKINKRVKRRIEQSKRNKEKKEIKEELKELD